MFKRIAHILLIFVIIFNFIVPYSYQVVNGEEQRNVLIVYGEENSEKREIQYLKDILSHFKVKAYDIKASDYKNHKVKDFDTVFIFNLEENTENKDLFQDLSEYKKNICWIGSGIEEAIDKLKLNFQYVGRKGELTRAYYYFNKTINDNFEKEVFINHLSSIPIVESKASSNSVYSAVSNGVERFSYIIKDKNFWYVSEIETKGPLAYIFSDILYEILDVDYNFKSKVNLVVDIASLNTSEEKFKSIMSKFYENDISFNVNVSSIDSNSIEGNRKEVYPFMKFNNNTRVISNSVYLHNKDSISQIVNKLSDRLNLISIVREGVINVIIDGTMEEERIYSIIEYLQENDAQFMNIAEDEELWIQYGNTRAKVVSSNEVLEKQDENKEISKEKGKIAQINEALIFIVGTFCVIFLIIFILSRRKNKRRFLE